MYIDPTDLAVTDVSQAPANSIIVNIDPYSGKVWIVEHSGERFGIILDGNHQFGKLPADGATNWKGVMFPEVRLEVEHTAFCSGNRNLPRGVILKRGGNVEIVGFQENHGYRENFGIKLRAGLADTQNQSAAFTKWRLVSGSKERPLVLHEVDLKLVSA